MISRRSFVAALAASAAGLRVGPASAASAPLPLAFSTLGTPAWSWKTILDYADAYGYDAIELRTLEGTEDLPGRPEFAPQRIAATLRQLAQRRLRVVSVDSSAQMHEGDPARRAAHMEEARRFIDLARALDAPYVRVFGDRYPPGEPRTQVIARVADGLRQLGDYAGERGVAVLLESHGDFTDSASLLEIMRRVASPHVGILWDAHHTFAAAGEAPEDTFRRLAPFIRHTHLKDSVAADGQRRYVLTGTGTVPVARQVEVLARSGYRGYYSFEWEKRWHPAIEEPEIAIPHFARVMHGWAEERLAPGVPPRSSIP